jgi:hypothetical protein
MTAPEQTRRTFAEQAKTFADNIGGTVRAAFDPDPIVLVRETDGRYVINLSPVPLRKNGCDLAKLTVTIRCCMDTVGEFLAVEKSEDPDQGVGSRCPRGCRHGPAWSWLLRDSSDIRPTGRQAASPQKVVTTATRPQNPRTR